MDNTETQKPKRTGTGAMATIAIICVALSGAAAYIGTRAAARKNAAKAESEK